MYMTCVVNSSKLKIKWQNIINYDVHGFLCCRDALAYWGAYCTSAIVIAKLHFIVLLSILHIGYSINTGIPVTPEMTIWVVKGGPSPIFFWLNPFFVT